MGFFRDRLQRLASEARRLRDEYPRETIIALRVASVAAIVVIAGFTWFALTLVRSLPDETAITRIGEMDQATAVYDASDGWAFTIYKEQRIEVPLQSVSPHLIRATLAIEDQRFYDHHGFDLFRIAGAAWANIRRGAIAQGASTITQQLARASFLTAEKTFRRKLQEVILAGRIERMYSKDRILELYLNKVYFGDGLHGVEAASRGFFGKHASELTVAEAATLAGLVKSPSSYAPTVSLERATARRNLVLREMLGAGQIDQETHDAARAQKIALRDSLRADEPYGLYFKEQVRRELVERFGHERVYEGGLRVYTTLDLDMQKAAEAAVADGLKALDERRKPKEKDDEPLQAALIAMDPATGHIRAMVGGREFGKSSFNRAVQARRQPGSAFKPFVYAAALEAGYAPSSIIRNLDMPIDTIEGAWTPEDEHSEANEMTLRTALRTSSNRAAVRLLQEVGIPQTVRYAQTLGVGDVPSVPSLALGSGEVTLQSMTAAYAAFANRGEVPTPIVIRRVEDRDGVVLYQAQAAPRRAITEATAFLMSTMLSDVINAGTAYRARRTGFTLPAAGKTGTTNDYKDAWFIGFTPSLIAGVWVGFDQPRTIMRNGFAGDVAVPLWATFMKTATRGDKPQWFKAPSGIRSANVCRITGKLASDGCTDVEVFDRDGNVTRRSVVYTEYFARGTMPTAECDLHKNQNVFGTLAGIFTNDRPAPPVPAPVAGLPPATVATAGISVPPPSVVVAPPEPEKRKRGFWSRLFGIGRGDDDGNDRRANDNRNNRGNDDRTNDNPAHDDRDNRDRRGRQDDKDDRR